MLAFYEVIRSVVFLGLGHAIIILFIFPLSIGIPIRSKFGSFKTWKRMDTNDDWNDFGNIRIELKLYYLKLIK